MLKRTRADQKGSALLLTTIITMLIVGIAGAYLGISYITQKSTTNSMFGVQALYAAEAGAAAYISALNANVRDPKGYPTPIASTFPPQDPSDPSKKGAALYNGATFTILDELYLGGFKKLTVTGRFADVTRKIEVIVTGNPGGVFWNAIFAGNKNPDGTLSDPYTLNLSGVGNDVDQVNGDIYSGGDFIAQNGAVLADETGAAGKSTVTHAGSADTQTAATYSQGTQENLLLPRDATGKSIWEQKAEALRSGTRMDLTDNVTYIDVAHDLNTKGNVGKWVEGSSATQITDSAEPAHIFRKNPTSTGSSSDRTEVYEHTVHAKSDYYIEDPTVSRVDGRNLGVAVNGHSGATEIAVQANGNNAVYFVDGNLRVSGEPVKSYQFTSSDGAPLRMTMVVKGNVSLTDNILYQSYKDTKDGVAFIAITDPEFPNVTSHDMRRGGSLTKASGLTVDQFVTEYNQRAAKAGKDTTGAPKMPQLDLINNPSDYERAAQEYNKSYGSGNVFFGDPGSGTVEHFEGFMYAENNFYATNLDSTTASGGTQQIEIWGNMTAGNQVKIVRDTTKAGYIPLEVTLNPLIKGGGNPPPALPSTPGFQATEYVIASWKQLP